METLALARIGESWSGYEIVASLGRLGMAELYRVHGPDGQARLLQVLAIRHPELIERLLDADLDRVDHPNVLGVFDVVSVLRFPGLLSADVVGTPLNAWVDEGPSLAERLGVFRGLAGGVAAMHAAGLTHGYLQPDAIIVDETRPRPDGWITLPGVAAVVFSIIRDGGAVSSSGASLGGPTFQAPEQQRSPANSDQRSDVFQLGCLLYYLLTGRSPFKGLDLMACYEAARSETYPAPGTGLDPAVTDLVRDLLRAEPAERPPAREVWERMVRIAPPPAPVRSWKPAAVGIGAVVGLLLVALAWWVLA